jgi:serine protease Do
MVKKAMSFLLAFLLLTVQACAMSRGQEIKMNLSQSIDKLIDSIVQISFESPTGRGTLGTGFFINDDGYVLTARHVIADIKSNPGIKLLVGVAYPNIEESGLRISNSFNIIESEVIDEDAIHDLAIIKLKVNPFKAKFPILIKLKDKEIGAIKCVVPELDPRRPKAGNNIAVSGYPFTGMILITTSGSIASSWGVESKEIQSEHAPLGFTRHDISDVYLADLTVNPGNSGGPVYTVDEGKIIGVCVSQLLSVALTVDSSGKVVPTSAIGPPVLYNSSVANIIPIKYAIDLLKKNKLKFEVN